LFRALILSEFSGRSVGENFYQAHNLPGVRVFDPFMGGGTTMMEANRVGCSVTGADINPMAWWIVRQELPDLDVDAAA
jgi:putative DNA methylase